MSDGNGIRIFPWINLLCVLITYISGYIFVKWFAPSGCLARNIYGLIIILFITPLTYTRYRYGWQISMALSVLSLLTFTYYQRHNDHSFRHYPALIIAFLIWILACLFKTNFVIVGIAYIITLLVQQWSNHFKAWPPYYYALVYFTLV